MPVKNFGFKFVILTAKQEFKNVSPKQNRHRKRTFNRIFIDYNRFNYIYWRQIARA